MKQKDQVLEIKKILNKMVQKINKYNVFNKPLEICSNSPLTGYFRDGCCSSNDSDIGQHQICSIMSADFLKFSLNKGNDLITPRNEYGFPGLREGDRWCLCVNRWIESLEEDIAPKIILEATSKLVLKKLNIEILKKFALDIN